MTGGLFGGGSIFFHPEMAIIRLFQTHIKLLTRDFRSTPNHQRKHPHKPPFRPWQALSSASSLGSQPGHSSHRSTPVWMDTWTSFSSLFRPLEFKFSPFWSPEDPSSLLLRREHHTEQRQHHPAFWDPETRTPCHPLSPRRSNDRHQGVVVRAVERPTSVTDRPVGPHLSGG